MGSTRDEPVSATGETLAVEPATARTNAASESGAATLAASPASAATLAASPASAATLAASPASAATLAASSAAADTLPARTSAAAPLATPLVGAARYERRAEIARGGMGRIIEARDVALERDVVLKELLEPSVAAAARFAREVRITARLQHPAIVSVYEAGIGPNGVPFFAMRRVDGEPLDRAIARRGTLAERLELLPSLTAVAGALAYAHSRGVVHRDLKPANVLVGRFGETVVIDWGIARELGEASDDAIDATPREVDGGLTLAGSVMGTPAYMAPEQARGEAVDARADVYALGAMLYELVSGHPPYEGPSGLAVLAAVLSSEGPRLELLAGAPTELRAIVTRAMARDRDQRYPDARALADDLARFQAGQLVGAHRYTVAEILARWARRHRAALSVGALAALALAVAIGVSYVRVAEERDAARAAEAREASAHEATSRALTEAARSANRSILARARAAGDDPPRVLALLGELLPEGGGFEEARALAAGAMAGGVPERVFAVRAPARSPAFFSPDASLFARVWGDTLVIFDLAQGTHRAITLPVAPSRFSPFRGGFAADGASIVVALEDAVISEYAEPDDRMHALRVDVATGAVTRIDGSAGYTTLGLVVPSARVRQVEGRIRWLDLETSAWRDLGAALDPESHVTSADGVHVVEHVSSGGAAGEWRVRVWSVTPTAATSSPIRVVRSGSTEPAHTGDGRWLLDGPRDGRAGSALVDAWTGALGARWDHEVDELAFSADGSRVATLRAGALQVEASDGSEPEPRVVSAPGVEHLDAVRDDGTVVGHDAAFTVAYLLGEGVPSVRLSSGGIVAGLTFSPDGTWLAMTGMLDAEVRLFRRDALARARVDLLPGDVTGLRALPDGSVVAVWQSSDRAGVVRFGPTGGRDVDAVLPSPGSRPMTGAPAITPDGSRIALAAIGTVQIFDGSSGALVFRDPTPRYDVRVAVDAERFVVVEGARRAFVGSLATPEALREVALEREAEDAGVDPGGCSERAELIVAGDRLVAWSRCGGRGASSEWLLSTIDLESGRERAWIRGRGRARITSDARVVAGVEADDDGRPSVVVVALETMVRRTFPLDVPPGSSVAVLGVLPDPSDDDELEVVLDGPDALGVLRTSSGAVEPSEGSATFDATSPSVVSERRLVLAGTRVEVVQLDGGSAYELGEGVHALDASVVASPATHAVVASFGPRVVRYLDDVPSDAAELRAWLAARPFRLVGERAITETLDDVHPSVASSGAPRGGR